MWRILHRLFGWDYVAWRNSADRGIARVHVDGMGRVFYWRYKCIASADFITVPERVIWLTCGPEKYGAWRNLRDEGPWEPPRGIEPLPQRRREPVSKTDELPAGVGRVD